MTETAENPVDTELDCHDVVLVTNDGVESTIRCDSRRQRFSQLPRGPDWY